MNSRQERNTLVRERINQYTSTYHTSYAQIGREAGLGKQSPYLISRFLKGLDLNNETLSNIENFLTTKGY